MGRQVSMGVLPEMAFVLVHPKHKLADQNTRPFPTATFAGLSFPSFDQLFNNKPFLCELVDSRIKRDGDGLLNGIMALWHFPGSQ